MRSNVPKRVTSTFGSKYAQHLVPTRHEQLLHTFAPCRTMRKILVVDYVDSQVEASHSIYTLGVTIPPLHHSDMFRPCVSNEWRWRAAGLWRNSRLGFLGTSAHGSQV